MIELARKFDAEKPDHSLIDPPFLDELAYVLMHGVRKYGRDNWRKPGLSINRICAAISRHCAAIVGGEDVDAESQLYHAAHIAAGAMFLVGAYERGFNPGFDDRFSSSVPTMRNQLGFNDIEKTTNDEMSSVSSVDESGDENSRSERTFNRSGISSLGSSDKEENESGRGFVDKGGDYQETFTDKIAHVIIPATDSITFLQKDVAEWANGLWPNRSAMTALTKMQMEEIPELITGGLEASELADVGILLLDIAALRKIDLGQAIRDKMKINRERTWKVNPETGLAHHIKEEI